jgi:hypothetical protein
MTARHLRVLLLGAERMAPELARNGPLVVVVEQTVSCTIASVRFDAERGLVLDAVCD